MSGANAGVSASDDEPSVPSVDETLRKLRRAAPASGSALSSSLRAASLRSPCEVRSESRSVPASAASAASADPPSVESPAAEQAATAAPSARNGIVTAARKRPSVIVLHLTEVDHLAAYLVRRSFGGEPRRAK